MERQELLLLKEELELALEQHKASRDCCLNEARPFSPPDVKPYILAEFENRNYGERVKTESMESLGMDDDHFTCPNPAKKIMLSSVVPISKPSRPSSLNVAATASIGVKNVSELAGIPIQTPSTGIQFNFDSLMVGGTGLTPVSGPLVPNCSTQQRIPVYAADLSSPDNCNPPKLVSL